MRIFLVALRRSGTTAFFDLMRQDKRFTCFDEPFNPMLRDLPGGNEWGTHEEFLRLFERDPSRFWDLFRPLQGITEITPELTEKQREFLRYLHASAENTFMDFTRLNFKIAELAEIAPDAILIHLHRAPACFASSHLLPSIWLRRRKLKYMRARFKFWTTSKKYDFWGMETIIGRHPGSAFGQLLRFHGLEPEAIFKLPAVARLMAYWKVAYDRVEADGKAMFGERFLSLRFEDFCRDPASFMTALYGRLGVEAPTFDFSRLHSANPPAFSGHPNWRKFADAVGLDEETYGAV
jgi:hypothetical protein